jgi:heme o synthase
MSISPRPIIPAISFAVKSYYLLTKPGIIMGNLITALGGAALALKGPFPIWRFLTMLLGLTCVIASACVFNNYIDRESDKKMARTKNRPLVLGIIPIRSALFFAASIGSLGTAILFLFVNALSAWLSIGGFFAYVILYSFSKYHSVYCTLIGSIAGALPPVIGYCSISNRLDMAAVTLFAMVALWQMPHFYAIAIFRLKDYVAANIPVFPNKKGIDRTKIHMLFFLIAFIIVSLFLALFAGPLYLLVTICVSIYWLVIAIQGFRARSNRVWARKMFSVSLIVIMALSLCLITRVFYG